MNKKIKRGSIFLCNLGDQIGSKQSGYRPVLVIQNDGITQKSSEVIVAPLTSKATKLDYPFHIYLGKRFGLDCPSSVLCEQITVIEKDKLKHYIGMVDDPKIIENLNNTVERVLGIKKKQNKTKLDIRCYCDSHRREIFETNEYILYRFDKMQVVKEKCDKCDRLGFDYIQINKKATLRRRGEKNG